MKKKTMVGLIAIAVIVSVLIFAGWVEKAIAGVKTSQLTTQTADDGHPAWSPDGKRIAFTSDRTGNFDIWVMDSDGSNQRQLTTHTVWDAVPAWSPDGRKIAFESDRTGNFDICVLLLE